METAVLLWSLWKREDVQLFGLGLEHAKLLN